MTFETIVDDLVALFDVTQAKAVAVVNDRLQDMVARSTALRALKSLGTTVAGQASYSLDAAVVQIHTVYIVNGTETTLYEGSATLEDFIALTAAAADTDGNWYVTEADTDSSVTTENLRLYPAPSTGGLTITGLVSIRPAVLTYATATALPIPTDVHDSLKAGAKAELYADEDRQDEAVAPRADYEAGIVDLRKGVEKRGKGTGSHRMRHTNYY